MPAAGGATVPGHCFRGTTTVAGVRSVRDENHRDFLYLLDRWYTACWAAGEEIPVESRDERFDWRAIE